jgi:membrane associated rhomboid family serine protease
MFLAFPLNDKPDWRNPPWMTILLIVVNCAIYFGWQQPEDKAWDKAAEYYLKSDLPQIELPRYVEHLRKRDEKRAREAAGRIETALAHGQAGMGLRFMEWDRGFVESLNAGRVVPADDPGHARWREQRAEFERMKPPPFTGRWASNPADWQPATLVTAAFLHGSVGHLIGNMVFLFAFGYTVELALGRGRYLAFYLLAGCAGEVGDLLARWGSPVIGLGASGAISGLMAMYAMIYGRRRIRFFYQLLFYFDYVKAPAIILLPAWIVHEFLQQWLNPEGGVAYMAHAGGLIGGALLLALNKRFSPQSLKAPLDAPADDGFAMEKAKAEALLKTMNLDAARESYARLVALRPSDRDALGRYFNLAKLAPDGEHFHEAARRVFALEGDDPPTMHLVHGVFRDYWTAAKPRPRLGAEQMARLAVRFARFGQMSDAERLTRLLLSQAPDHHGLPMVLLALVRGELGRNGRERAAEHSRTLATRFGGSAEARIAAELVG